MFVSRKTRAGEQLVTRHGCSYASLDETGDRVSVMPARPDVGSVLAGFDYLLLASDEEGFALVIAEAWLAGVPVCQSWHPM